MTKYTKRTWRIGLALLALASLLFLAAPQAFGAEAPNDIGADAIKIGLDNTITLISGHISAEQVSSVQFQLSAPAGTEFSFAQLPGDQIPYLSKRAGEDGTLVLCIYLAGSSPLMAEGQTSLLLGTISSDDLSAVKLVEGSLGYVYGNKVLEQTAVTIHEQPDDPAEALQALIDQAESLDRDKYSEASLQVLDDALAAAKAVLEDPNALPEDITAAIEDLQAALDALEEDSPTPPGPGADTEALAAALRDRLNELAARYNESEMEKYTPESKNALISAMENAEALLDPDRDPAPTSQELQDALDALDEAESGLMLIGKDALNKAIEKAEAELAAAEAEPGKYTAESMQALRDAIEEAKKVLNDPAADATAWENAKTKLEAVKLVPVGDPVGGGDPPGGEEPDDPGTGEDPSPSPSSSASPTSTPAQPTAPNTGDETVVLPWLLMICLSGVLLAAVLVKCRSKCK